MLCGWGGNRRSGVSIHAMIMHRNRGIIVVVGAFARAFRYIRKMDRNSLQVSTVMSSVSFLVVNGLVRFVSRT